MSGPYVNIGANLRNLLFVLELTQESSNVVHNAP